MSEQAVESCELGLSVCSAAHAVCMYDFYRSLGVHMSKVRSITLDSWEPELLKVMTELGNARVNQLLEAVVDDKYTRPVHNSLRLDLAHGLCFVQFLMEPSFTVMLHGSGSRRFLLE